ncbi:ribose-5-phosphate isomerase RpiA [Jeotgalibacillus sp. S-D1]|uniref:ribose-5-phosphate isomerase RpiA n=1 Tax=Jeotgalibacillus sp. S-D1 TaxID=2552189 RepID=UPI001059D0ED|nr:ribose-5-phosphate isomerase RpiA [Jeotgalibacillus sp. S-D1]TDL30903.1 ribose-5-phosphate isomerase RpiA [Jeotgalibacillus sp. S-D1]
MTDADVKKQKAGERAACFAEDGMVIGLGSGSTMYWTIRKLGELVQNGLMIEGVPTSLRTENWAKECGIPLTSFTQVQRLDLAIDGADEIDTKFRLTKGGGGSLVREKIVAAASRRLIIVADEAKRVQSLGRFPLPVEVVPFGFEATIHNISSLGCSAVIRTHHGKPFVSDNGNYVLDCQFTSMDDPATLHNKIKLITGVVETGLFIDMADIVIIGTTTGTKILQKNSDREG